MAASLHYLTVQDVLWINLEATQKRNPFNYATLEEATFYQYAYGPSNSLLPQAARFLAGFVKMHPFDAGNAATAFIGTFAFLRANGATVHLADGDAAKWFDRARASRSAALEAVRQIMQSESAPTDEPAADQPHEHPEPISGGSGSIVRGSIRAAMLDFPATVALLVARA